MHRQFNRTRTATLPAGGYCFPIPVPVNYIGVKTTTTSDSRGFLKGVVFLFRPVTRALEGMTSAAVEELLTKEGFELVTPDALIDGWIKYLPTEKEDDPPMKQIQFTKGENGFEWVLPENALIDKIMRIISREGSAEGFDLLPSVK